VTTLALDGLSVLRGETTALQGVSATASAGEFIGLIGPNGAGKTTLLRTIQGTLAPTAGSVRIDAVPLRASSTRAIAQQVATVPQAPAMEFSFPVRSVVEMGRTPYRRPLRPWRGHRSDAAAVDAALERTDLQALAERPIRSLSGGQQQRVIIARALAQQTPIILLDEPTANLDIAYQVDTLNLVGGLVAEGRLAVAAIHDLNLAAQYCDRLWLLDGGRLIADGPPATVLTRETLRAVYGANTVVSQHPVTGATYVTAVADTAGDDPLARVHVVGGGGTTAGILHLLDAAGYEVTTGVLHEGDTDTAVARQLGIEPITVDPYTPIDAAAARRARSAVEAADVCIIGDIEVGSGNLPNLQILAAAPAVISTAERPFTERNFAGAAAARAWEGLTDRIIRADPPELIGAVEAVTRDGSL
jgi:iron complex transport system ATP-binding protein